MLFAVFMAQISKNSVVTNGAKLSYPVAYMPISIPKNVSSISVSGLIYRYHQNYRLQMSLRIVKCSKPVNMRIEYKNLAMLVVSTINQRRRGDAHLFVHSWGKESTCGCSWLFSTNSPGKWVLFDLCVRHYITSRPETENLKMEVEPRASRISWSLTGGESSHMFISAWRVVAVPLLVSSQILNVYCV